jgi:hypothetical protein
MEPYIHQVLTYAQQSRERTNFEQAALTDKMAEYRRQLERSNMQSLSEVYGAPAGGDGMQMVGKSNNLIQKMMDSTPKGKVKGRLLWHAVCRGVSQDWYGVELTREFGNAADSFLQSCSHLFEAPNVQQQALSDLDDTGLHAQDETRFSSWCYCLLCRTKA